MIIRALTNPSTNLQGHIFREISLHIFTLKLNFLLTIGKQLHGFREMCQNLLKQWNKPKMDLDLNSAPGMPARAGQYVCICSTGAISLKYQDTLSQLQGIKISQ